MKALFRGGTESSQTKPEGLVDNWFQHVYVGFSGGAVDEASVVDF